ncbi:MAG TPA: O-antigen ligase family protein [Phototrophicaceae bacterium]|nr:O-antigen ligase family protein [Phototrophicaceae bacterium]
MLLNFLGRRSIFGKTRYFLERHYNRILRIGLVTICLGLTLVSTLLFRETRLVGTDALKGMLPILLMVGITIFVVFYYHLPSAILLVPIVSTVLAEGIGTGTGTKITFTFLLLYLLVFIWLYKMLVVERKLKVRPAPANVPILIFMGVVVFSLIWSSLYVEYAVSFLFQDKFFPRLMTMMVLLISPATYFLFANNIQSVRQLRFITWWFIAIGSIFITFRLTTSRLPSPLNDRGQFPTWIVALAAGQLLFNRKLHPVIRIGLLFPIAGWAYYQLGLGISWLSGWLPLVASLIVISFFYSRRVFAVLCVIGLIFALTNEGFIDNLIGAETTESGDTRSEAWSRIFTVYDDHILFGTGPAGYAFYLKVARSDKNFSHNNYIDIISQTGVFGITSFFCFWIGVAIVSLKGAFVVWENDFERGLAIALLGANASTFITMFLGDWVTPFPYTQGLGGIDYTIWAWILAGMTIALYDLRPRPQLTPAHEQNLLGEK